jgi:ElaB/YqjD/DUF883 family membrane-anchored ribosome-binding protein
LGSVKAGELAVNEVDQRSELVSLLTSKTNNLYPFATNTRDVSFQIAGNIRFLPTSASAHCLLEMSANECGISTEGSKEKRKMENGKANEPATSPSGLSQSSQGYNQSTQGYNEVQTYGQKISEAANQAKDYVSDKVTVVGDKIKELQNVDVKELAANATDYARKNPGQAILISAAAGLVLGLILRGGRR